MATRSVPFPAGTPCWVDLFTSDPERARAFYGAVLGWEFSEPVSEFGGYFSALSDGHVVAGMMRNDGSSGTPDVWSTYLATDDLQAATDRAVEAGAQVIAPPMPVGELGSMAVLVDPTGSAVGLWQSGAHTGFTLYNEPGGVTWSELHSRQFDDAKEFYARLAGWEYDVTSDTDEFRYVTATLGGEPVAGVMDSGSFLPPEVPPYWAVYFSVADVDGAVARAKAAGGTVLRDAEDTPFGRLADLLDPTGAPFRLHAALPQDTSAEDGDGGNGEDGQADEAGETGEGGEAGEGDPAPDQPGESDDNR